MDEKYNALFTPWKVCDVEIKNRIVQCSMGGTSLFGWLEPTTSIRKRRIFCSTEHRTA